MIYPDELSDSESAKVLQGFDIAESGHWIEQLDWSWWQSFKNESQEKYSVGTYDFPYEESRERKWAYRSPMCSGQKLPSTKAADFHLQNYNY